MSVNELAKRWLGGLSFAEAWASGDPHMEAYGTCAEDITEVARTAWKPVSEPPTEGHSVDMVLTWREGWTAAKLDRVGNVRQMARQGAGHGLYWAHQRDVVLLPPQSTTGEGE